MKRLIQWSIENRWIVMALSVLLAVAVLSVLVFGAVTLFSQIG